MVTRKWTPGVGVAITTVIAALVMWAVPAGAHEVSDFTVSCSTVSATVADTGTPDANDHPMVWNVKVGSNDFVAVPSTETDVGGPDQDVVALTGDIADLTARLAGASATVEAFVSFPSGTLPTQSASVTCGTPPTTSPTTSPPAVAGGSQVAGAQASRAAPTAVAPAAVVVSPAFTG
jgi:hypothetical protein